jgi:hypothetical protein
MRRISVLSALASAGVFAADLGGCAHRPPATQPTALIGSTADIGPKLSNYSQATVPANGLIVVAGDAFTASASAVEPVAKSKSPKAATLAEALAKTTNVQTTDSMLPGETIAAGAERLRDELAGNLLVICYGYGDAKAKTPAAAFQHTFEHMIRTAHDRGAAVFVVVEPVKNSPLSANAEIYRNIVRVIAAAEGAGLIDAPKALAAAQMTPDKTSPLPRGAAAFIGGLVAQYVKVAPADGTRDPLKS